MPRTGASACVHIALGKTAAALLGAVGLACGIVCAELYAANNFVQPTGGHYTLFKTLNTLSTAALLLLIVRKYRLWLTAERDLNYGGASHGGSCCSRVSEALFLAQLRDKPATLLLLVIELAVCAIHAPVGVSFSFESDSLTYKAPQSIDATLTYFMLVRLYLFVPALHRIMRWHSSLARVTAAVNKVRVSDWLIFRAVLDRHPVASLLVLWVVEVLSLAWALHAAEYSVCSTSAWAPVCDAVPGVKDLSLYWTAVWCTLITMLTVGYGDVSAVTTPGKIISVYAAFIGSVLNALLVAVVMRTVSLSRTERKTADIVDLFNAAVETKSALRDAAACVLQLSYKDARKKRLALLKDVASQSFASVVVAAAGARNSMALKRGGSAFHAGARDIKVSHVLKAAISRFRQVRLKLLAPSEAGATRDTEDTVVSISNRLADMQASMLQRFADLQAQLRRQSAVSAAGVDPAAAGVAPDSNVVSVAPAASPAMRLAIDDRHVCEAVDERRVMASFFADAPPGEAIASGSSSGCAAVNNARSRSVEV